MPFCGDITKVPVFDITILPSRQCRLCPQALQLYTEYWSWWNMEPIAFLKHTDPDSQDTPEESIQQTLVRGGGGGQGGRLPAKNFMSRDSKMEETSAAPQEVKGQQEVACQVTPIGRGSGRGKGYRVHNSSRKVTTKNAQTPETEIKTKITEEVIYGVTSPGLSTFYKAGERLEDSRTDAVDNLSIPGLNEEEKCLCLSNFFKLKKVKDVPVFEYRVSFKPPVESNLMKKKTLAQLEETIGPMSNFIGNSLFLPMRLPNEVVTKECDIAGSFAKVEVTLKLMNEKTYADSKDFYTLLLQKVLLRLGFIEVRKGFYKPCDIVEVLDKKLQIWPGVALFVEVKEEGDLLVMVETPSRVLRKDSIYEQYEALRNMGLDEATVRDKFSKYVIGKIVFCQYSNQCYKIDDIDWDCDPSSEFNYRHKMIKYRDYYKMKYGITIKNVEQPMLISKIQPRKTFQPPTSTECVRNVSLVPELCYSTGLSDNHKESSIIKPEIIRVITPQPAASVQKIRSLIKDILTDELAKQMLNDWGVTVDTDVLEIPVRVMDPPYLMFSKNVQQESVQTGPEFSKLAQRNCYDPVGVTKFLVVCTKHDSKKCRDFLGYYYKACEKLGIACRSQGEIITVDEVSPSNFLIALEKSCKPNQVQFVMVVVSSVREDVYRAVKRYCLTVVPTPSQCILSKTLIRRTGMQLALNVCMQINCKLGGSLWGLELHDQTKKMMFLGMDAAHDPKFKNPSIIALIATLNNECTKYFSRSHPLPVHQEVNTCLRMMFYDALMAYKKHNNGRLPDHIIFYRDGGCAETFDMLKRFEVDVCMEVLKEESMNQEKPPAFSYVCVAKRVPQRFYLRSEGRNIETPLPGTLIETTVTERGLYDFYIVSQQVNQGTASPTHYTVLYETSPTTPDDMQKFAYSLTFMYYNFSGTIKVPSVIQYAHKLGQLTSRVQCIPSRDLDNQLYFL